MFFLPILFKHYVALMIYDACKALKLAKLKNCVPDGDHLYMEDIGVQTGDFHVKVDFNT